MVNVVCSRNWSPFGDPTEAIVVRMKDQPPRAAMLCRGLSPKIHFRLVVGDTILYEGDDEAAAQQRREEFDEARWSAELETFAPVTHEPELIRVLAPLEANRFVLWQSSGGVIIDKGVDTSDRCLLFVGEDGRDNGFAGASLDREETDGHVLAHFETHWQAEVAVLLNVGQSVVFKLAGGLGVTRVHYSWHGDRVLRFVSPSLDRVVIPSSDPALEEVL